MFFLDILRFLFAGAFLKLKFVFGLNRGSLGEHTLQVAGPNLIIITDNYDTETYLGSSSLGMVTFQGRSGSQEDR